MILIYLFIHKRAIKFRHSVGPKNAKMKKRSILQNNPKFHGGRHTNTHLYSDVVRGNKAMRTKRRDKLVEQVRKSLW